MISFRLRPTGEVDWETAQFDGENEELLAHMFQEWLEEHGWEILDGEIE